MKYHVTAAKKVKVCQCNPCKAKHGQYNTEEEAQAALTSLNTGVANPKEVETLENDTFAVLTDETETYLTVEDETLESVHSSEESVVPAKTKQALTDYLDDDLEFLTGDDTLLEAKPSGALIEQEENIIAWRLENFFDENNERRSRYALRNSPPILIIESSDGSSVEFLLTQQLSRTLAETFTSVDRGYRGMDPKKKESLLHDEPLKKKEVMINYLKDHPVKATFSIIFFLIVVITALTL